MTCRLARRRFSFSAFEDYTSCGERFRLKRVVKVPEQPGMAMRGGSAFHEWSEQHDLASMPIDHDPYPEPEDPAVILTRLVEAEEEETKIPRDQWKISGRKTKDKPNKEDFECWRDTLLPDLCEKYIHWRQETPWSIATDLPRDKNNNTIGVEYELEYYVRNTKLKAYVDRVMVDEHGNYGAVDLKTWSQERASVQLPTYTLGLQKRGVPASWGAYYNARKGTSSEPKILTSWTEDRLAALYDQAAAAESIGIYIPHPSNDCKHFCGVSAHCQFAM